VGREHPQSHAVHPISALQSDYSLFTRDLEPEVLPLLRELGIGLVPYSPLGHGFLTGHIHSLDDMDATDWRRTSPRFMGENFTRNVNLVAEIEAEAGATAAQVALALLLAKGDDIAPIPGTKRVSRLEENAAAADVQLTSDQIARLDALPAPSGSHHNEQQSMALDRG
jgi:aryl-alcohol dehydrogenase-like predicted oxidoreductase